MEIVISDNVPKCPRNAPEINKQFKMEKQFKKPEIQGDELLEPVNVNGEIIYIISDPPPRIIPKSGIDTGIEVGANAVQVFAVFLWRNRKPVFSILGVGGIGYGVYFLVILIPWAAVILFLGKILGAFLVLYLIFSAFSNTRHAVPFDDVPPGGSAAGGDYIEEVTVKGRFKNIDFQTTTEIRKK